MLAQIYNSTNLVFARLSACEFSQLLKFRCVSAKQKDAIFRTSIAQV